MKESKYKINGKLFRITEGLGYDQDTASLVPIVVVVRPTVCGEVSLASASSIDDGIEKLSVWVSVPVERMPEFAI